MKISQNKRILVCDLSKKMQANLYRFVQVILKDFSYDYRPVSYPFFKLNADKVLIDYDLMYKKQPLMIEINGFNILAVSINDLEQANFMRLLLEHKINFEKSFLIFYDYLKNNQHHKQIINFLKMIKNPNYIILENIKINLLPNSLLYWKIVSLL